MSNRMLVAAALILILPLAACASRDRTPAPSTSLVTAAAGGAVLSESHDISIPAMALAEDTEITLSVAPITGYPTLEFARSNVVLINPEGTVLEVPAQVTIHASLIAASEGDTVSISQLISGDGETFWSPVESVFDPTAGTATVPVTRFAPLAIVVRAAPDLGTAAQINGTIVWGDGSPAADVPVEFYMGDSILTTSPTDSAGRFAFGDLSPGVYNVVVNFECMLSETVEVAGGETVDLALTLCGSV